MKFTTQFGLDIETEYYTTKSSGQGRIRMVCLLQTMSKVYEHEYSAGVNHMLAAQEMSAKLELGTVELKND